MLFYINSNGGGNVKIRAVINLVSGKNNMHDVKQNVILKLKNDFNLSDDDIYYTTYSNENLKKSFIEKCDILVVAGGDGTLHTVINKIKAFGLTVPIAYLPTGTTNDFGSCLSLPRDADNFCNMLNQYEIKNIDLGLAGSKYFHYVVAGGAMTSISYTTNQTLKNKYGKMAYCMSVFPQLSSTFKGMKLRIESKEVVSNEDAIMYFVARSSVVAGFKGFIPDAKIDDGMLHVLIFKKTNPVDELSLFSDILKGNGSHLKRSDVIYFTTKRVSIIPTDADIYNVGLDGELLTSYSGSMEIIPSGQAILVPKNI